MSKLYSFNAINGIKIYIDFERDLYAVHAPETVQDGKTIPERFIYNGKVDIAGSDLEKMKSAFLGNYKEIV